MHDISYMIDGYKFNLRVCCLIENNNRYLLEKSTATDFLNLPGGRVQSGESTYNAILRELKEEINLVDIEPKLIKVVEQFFEFNKINYHEIDFVYYIKLPDTHEFCKQNQIQNLDNLKETMLWINQNELHNYKILPEFIYTLKNDNNISHLIFNKLNNNTKSCAFENYTKKSN